MADPENAEQDCLWCGLPTRQRLCDGDYMWAGEHQGEPWHWSCWAERQAWRLALAAENYGSEDSAWVNAMVAQGQLWLGLAKQLERLRWMDSRRLEAT